MELRLPYCPYEKQSIFHKNPAKFKLFIAGLGSGKTMTGSAEAIITMIKYPKSFGAILAPTYPLLRDSTIKTFMEIIPRQIIRKYNSSEHRLILINGSGCIFRPCDDKASIDRIRNINLDWFWMDEASLSPEYAFKVLIGRLRGKHGPLKGWVTTTPKGYNWIWRKWVSEPTKGYFYVHAKTSENPYLPLEYIETLRQEYTGMFARQEIEGEFTAHEGVVYPAFSRFVHVIDTSGIEMKNFTVGVDFGFTNPSAVLKIGFDYDGRAYIVKEIYQRHLNDRELAEMVKKEMHQEGIIYTADSANPAGIREFNNFGMSTKGVKKVPGERDENYILAGIKFISSLLEMQKDGKPRIFVDSSCANTIMEFENYSYDETVEGKPIIEKPMKIHDHAMDALRYALYTGKPPLAFGSVNIK